MDSIGGARFPLGGLLMGIPVGMLVAAVLLRFMDGASFSGKVGPIFASIGTITFMLGWIMHQKSSSAAAAKGAA